MNTKTARTLAAIAIGFVIALLVQVVNGREVAASITGALIFSVLVGALVAVLSWGVEYAQGKGYPGWFGFLAILILNILGVLLLLVLPSKKAQG